MALRTIRHLSHRNVTVGAMSGPSFSDALAVRISQLQANFEEKRAKFDACKREVASTLERFADEHASVQEVRFEEEQLEHSRIEMLGAELLLKRELKRKESPEFIADLEAGDAELAQCDPEFFHREFKATVAPKIFEIGKALAAVYAEAMDTLEQHKRPYILAIRRQSRLGGLRVVDNEVRFRPDPNAVGAAVADALRAGMKAEAGSNFSDVAWHLRVNLLD